MVYEWCDRRTGIRIIVDRKMDDYQKPPTKEECLGAGMSERQYAKAVLVKLVSGGSFSRGFGAVGKGSKGNW